MKSVRFSRIFLLILLAGISVVFLAMIRPFLLSAILAAISAGLAAPLYRKLLALFRGRRVPASLATMLVLLAFILVPLMALLGIVAKEAFEISERVKPWVAAQLQDTDLFLEYVQRVPGIERLEPYRAEILKKAGEAVGSAGTFLFNSISATTRGTVAFFFQFFIFLYTLFFFLMDGGDLLKKILYYLPFNEADKARMVGKFTSVARATLKGTLLIGVTQGSLAGLSFWIAGIGGPVFWGAMMTVLSVIPGIGTALVWLPAGIILLAAGNTWQGILVLAFCGVVVSSIDNLLRPRLVGRDTQMHDLLIFFGTLGGILLFGVLGFIIGPILAALFVTVWDIYGQAFSDVLRKQDSPAEESEGSNDV
ncbi:MAG: AI-2E family transporter [Candidatus Eisenbacteria sp.]|nr:AI-2E family transporter [Candidatus Eisenbacteria bacterium]